MNLTFSTEHSNLQELRLLEILRIKELISDSQTTVDDAMALDGE